MAGFRDALRALFTPPPGMEPPPYITLGEVVNEGRALTSEDVWGSNAPSNGVAAGVTVNNETAMRSIAVQAAVRLLVNDIGSLPVDAFRKQQPGRKEIARPSFVVAPVPNNPNATWEDHVKQVVHGMLTDGNAFTYCFPSVFDVQAMRALDPRRVAIKPASGFGEVTYEVQGIEGPLTASEIVHIPWMVPAGEHRGLNPIEAAKQGLGIALASDEFVGSYFGNGAVLSSWIKVPPGVDLTEQQILDLKAAVKSQHVGSRKSHAIGALTGGAELVPFDYNNRNAQLLELRDQIVEEVARLFGIPPHMLGSQKPGAVGYASVEQRSIDYVTHAVLPIVKRIEVAYSRLLRGQQTYLRFNMNGLLRGDLAARAAYYDSLLQNKVYRREEVRALEDLDFDAEGVGYLETPNNNAPADPATAQEPAA